MPNRYQWEENIDKRAQAKLSSFQSRLGVNVLERDKQGNASRLRLTVYTEIEKPSLYVIGPFNKWGRVDLEKYQLHTEEAGYAAIELDGKEFSHKTPYLLLDRGVTKQDPASVYFNKEGHSVFWDFEDPSAYQMTQQKLDRINRSVKILQTDLPGLITHFRMPDGTLGHENPAHNYYDLISRSGVISKIAELGFNSIQFLPISQSIDGDKWSFRYLVPYLYAINNRWGDPDSFARMVDEFHKHGIAVILDHVISHTPHQRFRLFDIPNRKIGLHHWENSEHNPIFLGEETSWGTMRYQYHNPHVRKFIVDSAITLMKNFKVDGFRIDNVDGILRHGENGDGPDRHGGRELLRDLAESIYKYDPTAYIHLESHYFHGDNSKMLVSPLDQEDRSLGATAYTSSRLTYYFHREYMPKAASEISPWKIKDVVEEQEWGGSNSTVADFHNHDAAAGLIPMRATGSYAYDALILNNPTVHPHAVGKIKVMEAIISLGMEGRTLDLLQSHLLQTGTFEHDSTIHWYLEQIEASKGVLGFKTTINKLMDSPAFYPINVKRRKYANVHEESKTLTIFREDHNVEQYVILVNMAAHVLFDFVIPVPALANYNLILNSDELRFAGQGVSFIPSSIKAEKVSLFEHFAHGLRIGTVPSYGVIVFKREAI